MYRPPSGDKHRFVELLTECIELKLSIAIFIAGDFNINVLNNDNNHFELLSNNTDLRPKISEPTRIASNTCIDNVITNIEGTHTVSKVCIADHQAVISKLRINVKQKIQIRRYKYREMSEANWFNFKTNVTKLKIRGDEVVEMWSNLCDDIKQTVSNSFPEKESKKT